MPIYPGRRPNTLRIVVWARGKPHEETWEDAKDRAGARDREAQMRLELRAKGSRAQAGAKFSSFCLAEYKPHARAVLRSSTWRTRKYNLATLMQHFKELPLVDFTTEAVDAFKVARLEQGLEPGYINLDLNVLGAILHWAAEDRKKLVGDFKIRLLPTGQPRVQVWTSEQVERLLLTARRQDPELEPMILWLLNTGCRKGEAIAAESSWVDERARMLRIPVTKYWRPKSGRPRDVPLSDSLWEMLRRRERTGRFIFPNRLGEGYMGFPEERYRAVRNAAGLSGGPHVARHTFASHFLQACPDLKLLSEVLGHSQLRVTLLYTHLLPGHLEAARNAVNFGGRARNHGATMAKRRAS